MGKNKVLISRLLLFVLALPTIFCLIFFLPYFHHLALNIAIMAVSVIGSFELVKIFKAKGINIPYALGALLGLLCPLTAYLELIGIFPRFFVIYVITIASTVIFLSQAFIMKEQGFQTVLFRIGACLVLIFYPGFFFGFMCRLGEFEAIGTQTYLTFIIMVYLNDSAAWLFGKLFGKNSRKVLPVSPNKSLIGFIFGMIASMTVAVSAYFLFPGVFGKNIVVVILMGLIVGFSAILGDLAESAIKRGGDVKDSGTIIPGRGGLLDSVDSLLFSAPIFYVFMLYFTDKMKL